MKEYKITELYVKFESFVGKTLMKYFLNEDENELLLEFEDGEVYLMHHEQECCESVWLEDIAGNLEDLIGSELLMAEEVYNNHEEPLCDYADSYLWTYYKLATIKGYVTLRWYGESNGYYSEGVDIHKIKFI